MSITGRPARNMLEHRSDTEIQNGYDHIVYKMWLVESLGFSSAAQKPEVGNHSSIQSNGPSSESLLGNAYTFTLIDTNNLISSAIEAQITANVQYVISLVSRYIEWHGTMDFVVDIKPDSQSPFPDADGILPSVAQIAWNGSAWINQTLDECLTGNDSNTALPDAGCTIYLASDGSIRNYGAPVWFDPNPQFGVDPNVPSGQHDFIGIYTHEIFHGFGFYPGTQQWDSNVITQNGISHFQGDLTSALHGGQLPFASGTGHYGAGSTSITRGLMYEFGNYALNRFDIGRIDLAVLEDLGHAIKTYEGLPLFEFIDTAVNLSGTSGHDTLYGDYHANILNGGSGNDILIGGAGADRLVGSLGDDIYRVEDAGDIIVEGVNEGNDTLRARVSYQLADNVSVETMAMFDPAGSSAIGLTGNNLANIIIGNAGANLLRGLGGNDVFVGGGGADILEGGAGDDIYYIQSSGATIVEAASEGNDRVAVSTSYVLAAGANVDMLDAITLSATTAMNLTGNAFNNRIVGNDGTNIISSGGGNDELQGAGGDDYFVGSSSATGMFGGTGNDTYYIADSADAAIESANGGNDRVAAFVSYTLASNWEVETLEAVNLTDTTALNFTGNGYANAITGNAGANILDGGGGADSLNGYSGADIFAFTTALGGGNIDTLYDFNVSDDTIRLDDAVFAGLALGALNSDAFTTGAATDAADRIVYNASTGQLFFDADGSGSGAAVQFATLLPNLSLSAADFVVI